MKVLAIGETRDVRSGWGRYAHEVLSQYASNGIDYEFVSRGDLLSYSPLNLLKNVFRIRRKLKNATVAHSFDVWPFAVYTTLANLGIRKPHFVSGVGTYSLPPKRGLKGFLMRLAYKKAEKIFCISNYTQTAIKKRGAVGNMEVVHWGTTVLPKIAEEEKKEFSSKFGINPKQNPIILTVGQIKNRKGQLDTLKAVKILKGKYPYLLYITVGSTADRTYVGKMIDFAKVNNLEDNLLIVDTQKTDRELAFFYSISDVFVMNSNNEGDHFEGFGLVFLEAAQFGKPAVGSRDCGIEDAIVDGETGYLSKQADGVDIAEKLDFALKNKELLGQKAMKRASQYTWENTVDKYLAYYTKSTPERV